MAVKNNILSLLEDKTNAYSDKVALGIKTAWGWKEFSYKGIGYLSKKLASYLINELQVKKDEKLAILSESKPEYGACVFASVISGMTTVPLDIKLTNYELISILSDCKPTVMLVSKTYIKKALELQKDLPSLKHIILMDEPVNDIELMSLYTLPSTKDTKWRHRHRASTVFIIYTSGTTGAPKGVETTFGNMLSQLSNLKYAIDIILPKKDVSILSILPMNHLFEMTVGFVTFLSLGFSVYYTHSLKPKDIMSVMREKKIQFMIVVPAFLKLLKTSIEAELKTDREKRIFKIKYNLAKFIPSYTIKRIMFRDILAKFGGNFMGCISGGAPLDVSVGEFFERIGIKVYQAYGLTETSPVASVNVDKRNVLASVGRPLPDFKAKVNKETGELLLKGPSIMKGYHNQPELTAQAIDADGWFHTGDKAEIDKDGHIFITGRIKNMIVLAGGKKVFPEEVEAVLEKSPLFAELCVFGYSKTFGAKDGTEDVAVVVVPTEELINKYDDVELEKIIRAEVKSLSQQLTAYKRPINVMILKEPLPRTKKDTVKRNEVKQLVNA